MQVRLMKKHEDAILPSRAFPTDVGLDLTAIAIHQRLPSSGAILYRTGWVAQAPPGCYLELVPRSSISKTGWILANGVGTIDPHYTGELYIALNRLNPEVPELTLPFCACQIVVRQAIYAEPVLVEGKNWTGAGKDEKRYRRLWQYRCPYRELISHSQN